MHIQQQYLFDVTLNAYYNILRNIHDMKYML